MSVTEHFSRVQLLLDWIFLLVRQSSLSVRLWALTVTKRFWFVWQWNFKRAEETNRKTNYSIWNTTRRWTSLMTTCVKCLKTKFPATPAIWVRFQRFLFLMTRMFIIQTQKVTSSQTLSAGRLTNQISFGFFLLWEGFPKRHSILHAQFRKFVSTTESYQWQIWKMLWTIVSCQSI